MSRFQSELPNDLIKAFQELAVATPKMMEDMVLAGAEVTLTNVKKNMKRVFKNTSELEKCLYISKNYKTPTDDGINRKVYVYGYLTDERGRKTPAPLVVLAREYGTKSGEAKKPFFRKSFKKDEIETAMSKVQEKYLPKEQ